MARTRQRVFLALLVLVLTWPIPGQGQRGATGADWKAYGADEASTRYSALDQINRDTVKNLQVAWTWKFDNFGGPASETVTTETTPLMVNGVLYFTAGARRTVVAARAATGETLWTWRPDEGRRFDEAPRKVHRGVAYWTNGKEERVVVVTPGFQLVSLDAKTGQPAAAFGQAGVVDLFTQLDNDTKLDPTGKIGNSSPPVIANDVIVVGPALTPGGRVNIANVKADIMGFDARTGKKLWTFHTIPRDGEPGADTWLGDSRQYTGNAGIWGPFSADPELGYVYLSVESATNDVYGGHRPGNNLYSDSLVCLDIKTGKMIWYQQLVHHDIWDYDMPPAPILVNLNVDGRPVRAVVQLTKQAFAYAFDRTNGRPVFPWEERPVPQTDIPKEWTAPTQPFPTRPPAFDLQGVSVNDLIDFTPELRAEAVKAVANYKLGPLYTPPTVVVPNGNRGTIAAPGLGGGANWQGGAADPETGFVYVGSTTNPANLGLVPNTDRAATRVDADYVLGGQLPTIQGLRLLKPPYGRITALDMNKGTIAWQRPNGDTPPAVKNNPALKGLNVPPTGSPSQAMLLVTKTLLLGGEGSGGQPVFHAYDKATGEEVWQTPLPGAQTSLPMTYSVGGRQFVVFGVRGNATSGAQLVAFALPVPAPAGGPGRGGRGGAAAGQGAQ
ncbi:MAG TPA: PQQ-binding-like beta-propeller repeat protein [Vicinamibacterales bacterium]